MSDTLSTFGPKKVVTRKPLVRGDFVRGNIYQLLNVKLGYILNTYSDGKVNVLVMESDKPKTVGTMFFTEMKNLTSYERNSKEFMMKTK